MYQIYKVESSDTLDSIANKFGISVDKLREINGFGNILPGGYILVPNMVQSDNLYYYYIVKNGDTLYSIARKYNVSYDTLLRLNGLNSSDYIYPNQEILIPKSDKGIYITKENDTIQSLYDKYGNNWSEFLIQNKNILVVPDQMVTYK